MVLRKISTRILHLSWPIASAIFFSNSLKRKYFLLILQMKTVRNPSLSPFLWWCETSFSPPKKISPEDRWYFFSLRCTTNSLASVIFSFISWKPGENEEWPHMKIYFPLTLLTSVMEWVRKWRPTEMSASIPIVIVLRNVSCTTWLFAEMMT